MEGSVNAGYNVNHMDAEARFAKFERRLDAITKLIQTGMKMIVRIENQQKKTSEQQEENEHAIRALIETQMNTEVRLQRLIEVQERTETGLQRLERAQQRTDGKLDRLITALRKTSTDGR